MKIALLTNFNKENALTLAMEAAEILKKHGAEILVLKDCADILGTFTKSFETANEIIENCDICVVIGGDGTTIHYACTAAQYGKPVLGINAGRVGYISELEGNELNLLSKLFKSFETEKRMMICAQVINAGKKVAEFQALNDIVLSRGSLSQMVDFEVFLNDKSPSSYRADGIIFSTPTGSTAYSFSAGGPVVDPRLFCILLSPVCAHLPASARTVIFSSESEIKIKSSNSSREIYLTVDGADSYRINENDIVKIKKSSICADFIKIKDKNFYKKFNEKIVGG